MALFFAAHRWGDGEGIFNYSREAKELLHTCIHKGENGEGGRAMWMLKSSDSVYHGCGFFGSVLIICLIFSELFALWAKEEDRAFFKEAAEASRNYLKRACHPVTGLSAEYAEFDGTPYQPVLDQWGGRHDWYYSDAYRTIANIALDYEWFAKDEWESENVDRFLNFFCDTVQEKDRDGIFLTDGTILEGRHCIRLR